ncbi:MAG: hypothetical protein QXS77_01960 [Candidatus Pacearchaeota archaeon]
MKKNLIFTFAFSLALLFLLLFPMTFAEYSAWLQENSINEDVSSLINISINNSYETEESNITQVNITLLDGFIFIADSNGSSVAEANFYNTSNVLSWEKDGLVMNNSIEHFWFNVTVSEPGDYNLTITITNATGSWSIALELKVNDTTAPSVTLNAPVAYANFSTTNITFNCTAQDNYNLSNITLYGNWSGWDAKNSSNVSGTNNTTTFTHSLAANARYLWACQACDAAGNCNFSSNRTLTIDTAKPEVHLKSPTNNYNTTLTTIDFKYNVTDNFGIKNCSLYIDGSLKQTDTSIENGTQQEFSDIELEGGTYEWQVKCYDYAGNSDSSETWSITIKSSTSENGESGTVCTENAKRCSGDALQKCINNAWQTIEYCTYGCNVNTKECNPARIHNVGNITGTNKTINNVAKDEKINFTLGNESHIITVKNITSNSTTLEINSIVATIYINETKEFDLNANNINDFSITVLSISNNKVDLMLRAISEPSKCEPNWNCTAWSSCIDGVKTRTCIDLNNCGIAERKPEETKECSILEKKFGKAELWRWLVVIVACVIVALLGIIIMIARIKRKRKLLRR